ncbi:zinc-binding dehydrogenase [Mesorhizobium sp. LCM 4577]|uniref:zinc-binding dehydrogenase n=1 Tax=unclassified Mesorhizobium TaxID=325217 RepID=UPI0008D900E5
MLATILHKPGDVRCEEVAEGIARIKELTNDIGADSVLECVGTGESFDQALACSRPGGKCATARRFLGVVGSPDRPASVRRHFGP